MRHPKFFAEIEQMTKTPTLKTSYAVLTILLGTSALSSGAFSQVLDPLTQNLFSSIYKNDIAAVQDAIAKGANLSVRDASGDTPYEAAQGRHFDTISAYIKRMMPAQNSAARTSAPQPLGFSSFQSNPFAQSAVAPTVPTTFAAPTLDAPSKPIEVASPPPAPVAATAIAPEPQPEPVPAAPRTVAKKEPVNSPKPVEVAAPQPPAKKEVPEDVKEEVKAPEPLPQIETTSSIPSVIPAAPAIAETTAQVQTSTKVEVVSSTPEANVVETKAIELAPAKQQVSTAEAPQPLPDTPTETVQVVDDNVRQETASLFDKIRNFFSNDQEKPASHQTRVQLSLVEEEPKEESQEKSSEPQASQQDSEPLIERKDSLPPPAPELTAAETESDQKPPLEPVSMAMTEKPVAAAKPLSTNTAETATPKKVNETKDKASAQPSAQKNAEVASLPNHAPSQNPASPKLLGNQLGFNKHVLLNHHRGDVTEKSCFNKDHKTITFCIVNVEWLFELESFFDISSILHQPSEAIVRYDDNRATRIFSLFRESAFDAVVAHFSRQYGAPTIWLERSVKAIKQGTLKNPVAQWHRPAVGNSPAQVLEIRRFDDTRGGFADMRHGMIRIYNEEAQEIFSQASELDFMMLR